MIHLTALIAGVKTIYRTESALPVPVITESVMNALNITRRTKTMPKTIIITKEDFDDAVVQVMANNMENPTLKENVEALMLYITGGVSFAKHVGDILFHDDCEEDDG